MHLRGSGYPWKVKREKACERQASGRAGGISSMLVGIDDFYKVIGFKRCSANEAAIHIRIGKKFLCI